MTSELPKQPIVLFLTEFEYPQKSFPQIFLVLTQLLIDDLHGEALEGDASAAPLDGGGVDAEQERGAGRKTTRQKPRTPGNRTSFMKFFVRKP